MRWTLALIILLIPLAYAQTSSTQTYFIVDASGYTLPSGEVVELLTCDSFTNQSECLLHECAWLYNGQQYLCKDSGKISCSDYKTNYSCISDSMSLGKKGIDTEKCRTNTYVNGKIVTNCRCYWEGRSSGNCTLAYDVKDAITFDSPNGFSCIKKFSNGDCVNGQQTINMTATWISLNSTYTPTNETLVSAGCVSNTKTLACGEKLAKLPFFTIINFILSVFILAIIYFIFRKKF